MPLFVLSCIDKPNALDLRMATREEHLAYAREHMDKLKMGGPFLSPEGEMAGSLMVLEVEDQAAAEAFSANDPYRKAGLFERVDIRPFRMTLGKLG